MSHEEKPNSRPRDISKRVEILSVVVGAVVPLFFGFEAEDLTKLPRWWMPWVFGLAGVILSWAIVTLARLSRLRTDHQEMLQIHHEELVKTRTVIEDALSHISLISGFERHPIVFEILSKYANQIVTHITGGPELVPLEEYLELLNLSLERVTTRMFSTSLIPPSAFLENAEVLLYLKKQANRVKVFGSSLKMERVFICDGPLLDSHVEKVAKEKIIKLHKDAGIRVGFCKKADLQNLGQRYCRDFVYFQSNAARWVVDAGDITSAAQGQNPGTKPIQMQIHMNKEYIDNNWTTTLDGISDRTDWID